MLPVPIGTGMAYGGMGMGLVALQRDSPVGMALELYILKGHAVTVISGRGA